MALFLNSFFGKAQDKPSLSSYIINEEFESLSNWAEIAIYDKLTKYTIYTDDSTSHLEAKSNTSASLMMYNKEFNVYENPKMKWRWKVENVYENGDLTSMTGDDYPLTIYVAFKYQPDSMDFFDKISYKSWKTLIGREPPHSMLRYVWANKKHIGKIHPTPYPPSSGKIIIKQQGCTNCGKWLEENLNILEDYRSAFGENPPQEAVIGFMNDSDNTGESSVSYLDYIKIGK
ncbi:DUF3047 domain-containing protein [Bacteroidales bacterium AH-315-I05]|nr:DUF3047 domain-containing protein [Bacteroidales bacterium AH-315-I05]